MKTPDQILYVLINSLLVAVTANAEPKTVYELPSSGMAVCKENCKDLGVADCENSTERKITATPIEGTSITIKGRGMADANSCYSDGRVTAEFESKDGKVSKHGEAVIKCKSSNNFTIEIPLESLSTGELTVYSKVSDWCTTVKALKVFVE